MKLYNPYQEYLTGPARHEGDIFTLAAGEETTFRAEALLDKRYGLRRILFNDDYYNSELVTASLKKGRRSYEWRDVHLRTINRLFSQRDYEPGLPIIVPAEEDFRLEIKNRSSTEHTIRLLTEIMEPDVLRQREQSVRRYLGSLPDVAYAYAFQTIPAGAQERDVTIEYPTGRWLYDNFTVHATADNQDVAGESVFVKQVVGNETTIERAQILGPESFTDFNDGRRLPAPIEIGPSGPVGLRVTNDSGVEVTVSVLIPLVEASADPATSPTQ